jgi:hypothetical protein
VADRRNPAALSFAPVLCQQKPAARFGKSVDLNWSPTISGPLDQAFVAETEKISMELTAATKRQAPSNLSRVMPESIAERLEHQTLQFTAFPHRAILPAFVSTLLFVIGTLKKSSRVRETAKACTLREVSRANSFFRGSHYFLQKRHVSNA